MLPQVQKILFATDFRPVSAYALRFAISEASKYQAKVYVVHIMERFGPFAQSLVQTYVPAEQLQKMKEDAKKDFKQKIESTLNEIFEKNKALNLEQQDLIAGTEVLQGEADVEMIKYAKKIDADMIVIGAHKHHGFTFLGSTARKVVNNAHIPVLVVPTPKEYDEEE